MKNKSDIQCGRRSETRQFDRPVQMTGRIARIVKVAPQFTFRSQDPSAPKKKKSDRKTQWRPEQMLEPRGTTLTSRPAKFPVGSDAFTCNGRFPINRLQAPINRTGRMMMTSSAAQFHPFTNSNLPPRYSSGAERCGKKKTPQSQTTKKWTTPVQIRLLPLYSVSSRTHRRLQFSGG